jgi:hypothetical protein
MSNTGKSLEELVGSIESVLLSSGYSVDLRRKIIDDNGKIIAEFDIVIVDNSNSIVCLIECRDRPSEGKAPVSWVEQLVGRRIRFGFDKVMAVSTTGFSKSAEEFALREGIELHNVNQIKVDEVRDWLEPELGVSYNKSGLLHAELRINEDSLITYQMEQELGILSFDSPILKIKHKDKYSSLKEAWVVCMHKYPELFDDIVPDTEPVSKRYRVLFPNAQDRYQTQTSKGIYDVFEIVFDVYMFIEIGSYTISKVFDYAKVKSGRISQSVSFVPIKLKDKKIEIMVHKFDEENVVVITTNEHLPKDR